MSPEMLAKSKADNGAMDVSAHNKFLATGVQLLIERILRLVRFGCYYSGGSLKTGKGGIPVRIAEQVFLSSCWKE